MEDFKEVQESGTTGCQECSATCDSCSQKCSASCDICCLKFSYWIQIPIRFIQKTQSAIVNSSINKLYTLGKFLKGQGAEILGTATDINKVYSSMLLGG